MLKKITITEALNELKLYDAKINKAINKEYVGCTKKSSNLVGVKKREDFINNVKSNYQSVTDLIKNRNVMKSAIVKSNATTELEINGKKMTVAEAIERKNSIEYEEHLLLELKAQYAKASDKVLKENVKVDNAVDNLLETLIGKESDKKVSKEDQEAIVEPYRVKNEYELVDPIGIYEEIEKLENEIDGFKSDVNTKLVLSNAITFIEVEM